MIADFLDVETLTQNTSIMPILLTDIKPFSQYFANNQTDTTQDTWIAIMIKTVVNSWEAETGFLLLDQTFKTSLYNQIIINNDFFGIMPRLNIRSIDNVMYYPVEWNKVDPKTVLTTDSYFFTPEQSTTPSMFKLNDSICYLELYPVYNNFEVNATGGFLNNDFTNIPQDIKNCLSMQVSDIIDTRAGFCQCGGFYLQEIQRIYKKYKIFRTNVTI